MIKRDNRRTSSETVTTRKEILAAILKCAKKLGHPPGFDDLAYSTGVTRHTMRKLFGTHIRALQECGLEGRFNKRKLLMKDLLRDWATVAREVKRVPSSVEYIRMGGYSKSAFMTRFKAWSEVPPAFKRYVEEKREVEKWKDVLEMIDAHEPTTPFGSGEVGAMPAVAAGRLKEAKAIPGRPLYGPPMRICALAHCPTNEAGVIYLFGSLAIDLGFMVTSLQAAFPDCNAMRRVEGGKWQPVRVEFEYESRNFLKHMHDAKGCDLIVCWEHNWRECPVEVLELKSLVQG
jgi:hypothetical protein